MARIAVPVEDGFEDSELTVPGERLRAAGHEVVILEGTPLTSWPSVRKDLENAGASWVDREVVEDDDLLTSRKPDDPDAFCEALLRRLPRA